MTGTSTPNRARTAVRIARRRGVRVDRQQRHDRPGRRARRWRRPRRRWRTRTRAGLGDQHAVGHPDDPRASRRTTSTWRGSRSQRAANSIASGRGSTPVRSTTAPSAFDTTFWVTTSTSSSRQRQGAGRAVRGRRRSARPGRRPRRSPGCRPSGDDLDAAGASAGTEAPPAPSISTRTRSSGVSRSTASGAVDLDVAARPPRRPRPRWAARLPDPKANVDDVRRPERQGVGAGPVAVGDEDDDRCRRPPSTAADEVIERGRR